MKRIVLNPTESRRVNIGRAWYALMKRSHGSPGLRFETHYDLDHPEFRSYILGIRLYGA